MTSLIFSLLISLTSTAQTPAFEFITGFKMRPVRIVVTSLTQSQPDFVFESDLIARASAQVDTLGRSIDACARDGGPCELRVEIKEWSDLFALGTRLAGEDDFDWMFAPADAAAMAARAVSPFRDNWLYGAADAAVLNAIEDALAKAWKQNKVGEFTMHYRMFQKSIAADGRAGVQAVPIKLDVIDQKTGATVKSIDETIYLTGNPGRNADELKAALAKSLPPQLIERMSKPIHFTFRPPDASRGCRERLDPNAGS